MSRREAGSQKPREFPPSSVARGRWAAHWGYLWAGHLSKAEGDPAPPACDRAPHRVARGRRGARAERETKTKPGWKSGSPVTAEPHWSTGSPKGKLVFSPPKNFCSSSSSLANGAGWVGALGSKQGGRPQPWDFSRWRTSDACTRQTPEGRVSPPLPPCTLRARGLPAPKPPEPLGHVPLCVWGPGWSRNTSFLSTIG